MDDYSPDAFVNRDEPIPVVSFENPADLSDSSVADGGREGKRDKVKNGIKKKVAKVAESGGGGGGIQDRILEKLLQQIIPTEDYKDNGSSSSSSSAGSIQRPNFNITTMSNNFRRFNSRVGVIFVFQNRMIKLMSWQTWSHTLSFLAVYTFVCLDPYLLTVLPMAIALLAILIPSFVARHPAAPRTLTSNGDALAYSAATGGGGGGPPIAPARTVRPVKELSRDFFRNMRDLQNSMEDFSRVHDKVVAVMAPPTNFSNEPLSSALFLLLAAGCGAALVAGHLLPWRLVLLGAGWAATGLGHPALRRAVRRAHEEHVAPRERRARSWLDGWIARDIILDAAPEVREVEAFELQKRLPSAGEWQPWVFAPSPHDPMSEARIRDQRPRGARFFEDIEPPKGWTWSEKKWALDLMSRAWVEERIITGVEIETEGERWVYDIEYEAGDGHGVVEAAAKKAKGKTKTKLLPSWEEGDDSTSSKRGQWRRRRWTRLVKRKTLNND